jgi:hypothetical protein
MRRLAIVGILMLISLNLKAQVMLNDLLDTSSALGKGFLSMYEQYNWLRFSGYLQPQFQNIQTPGASSFNGGDYPPNVDNRFSLRRGRMRIDYLHKDKDGYPEVQLVFQFDGTERGFFARDFWGRAFEHRWHLFSLTGGIFARPVGYEVNLGSSDRESPERGRASQLLMKTERDVGAMLTLEPMKKGGKMHWLRADIAVMNGPGYASTVDYDSHKDVIFRAYSKAQKLNSHNWRLSGGLSSYLGGIVNAQAVNYYNEGGYQRRDSSGTNIGRLMPRKYFGADAQLKIPTRIGQTELRAEVLVGQQTGTMATSETPGNLNNPLVARNFSAAYFYFLQQIVKPQYQLVLKYDIYDANTDLKGSEFDAAKGNTAADLKYMTFGIGGLWKMSKNLQLMLYYEMPKNEASTLTGYKEDIKDNNFTARLQFRF